MTSRIANRIIDTESIKSAAREWGWAYAFLFSLQSMAYVAIVLWFGITAPPTDGFYPDFMSVLRDVGIAGLAAVVITTTILEGAQSAMIISATFLKPRERRIREEGIEEGLEKGREEGIEEGLEKGRMEGREQALAEMREREREQEREQSLAEGRAQEAALAAQTLDLERAAWRAWYERSELARAKGEEPPPPPFLRPGDNGHAG